MKLCRVLGNVVSTAKHPAFHAQKLLLVEPLDEHGTPNGASFIAVDRVQAGPGDVVLVNQEGNGARQLLKMGPVVPIRSLIVGIVDAVETREFAAGERSAPGGRH